MERKLAALAASQHGLITRHQALGLGLGTNAIQWRISRGVLEPVHAGVYRVAGSRRSPEQAILAACLAAGPGAAASHATAAELHGLPVGGDGIHISVVGSRRLRLPGLTIHRVAQLDRVDVVNKRSVPVTSVARTIVDVAAELRAARLEEVLDHALAARLVGLEQVRYRLRVLGTQGRPGAGTLAALIAVRLGGSRVPRQRGERLLEQILLEHDLPIGEREYVLSLPDGRVRRPDRAYPSCALAIQVDSFRHHSSLRDWAADLTRDNDLVAIGWASLTFTYEDLKRNPDGVAAVIRRTLAKKAGRD
jgi:Transcriptional regulator, AbiEi antitoxin